MEAEKTRAQAKQQEAIAARMKLENQAIRDEAEADLSEWFDRANGRRDHVDASCYARGSLSLKSERAKTLTTFSTTVACACTSRNSRIDKSVFRNRVQRTERWHNVGSVCSLTRHARAWTVRTDSIDTRRCLPQVRHDRC